MDSIATPATGTISSEAVLKMQNELLTEIRSRNEKMDKMFDKIEEMEKKQHTLEMRMDESEMKVDVKINETKAELDQKIQEVRDEVQEERRKLYKVCNIVLMGVPETQDGLDQAADVLNVIAPLFTWRRIDQRIGVTATDRPRPLKVCFPSGNERNAAIRQCHQLKKFPQFSHISVRKDLTKKEQETWKATKSHPKDIPRQTRASVKRKGSYSGTGNVAKSSRTSMELDA
jgi:hypothetical protein